MRAEPDAWSTRCSHWDGGEEHGVTLFDARGVSTGASRLTGHGDPDCPAAARMSWEPNVCVPKRSALPPPEHYRFSVIEFDDFGDLWIKDQFQLAQSQLSALRGSQVLLLVFVHGWRHSASESSSHFLSFRDNVRALAADQDYCRRLRGNFDDQTPCAVLGVYLGWRGASLGVRGLETITAMDRKSGARAASGIASTHVISSLLAQLVSQDRVRLEAIPRSGSHNDLILRRAALSSRSVLIGHSFGGRFLENALGQALVGRQEIARRLGVQSRIRTTYDRMQKSIDGIRENSLQIGAYLEQLRVLEDNIARAERAIDLANGMVGRLPGPDELEAMLSDVVEQQPFEELHSQVAETWEGAHGTGQLLERALAAFAACRARDREQPREQGAATRELARLAEAHNAFLAELELPELEGEYLSCVGLGAHGKAFKATGQSTGFLAAVRNFERAAPAFLGTTGCPRAEFLIDDLIDEPVFFDQYRLDYQTAQRMQAIRSWSSAVADRFKRACLEVERRVQLEKELAGHKAARETIARAKSELLQSAEASATNFAQEAGRLESAIIELLQDTLEILRSPADVAIMINPATEGLTGIQLDWAISQWRASQRGLLNDDFVPPPVLVQVASPRDWTTRSVFPWLALAQRSLFLKASPRSPEQRLLAERPLPQSDSHVTHVVVDCQEHHAGEPKTFAKGFVAGLGSNQAAASGGLVLDGTGTTIRLNRVHDGDLESARLTACSRQDASPVSDYKAVWAVRADGALITGHNDVFGHAMGAIAGALASGAPDRRLDCSITRPAEQPGGQVCDLVQRLASLQSARECHKAQVERLAAAMSTGKVPDRERRDCMPAHAFPSPSPATGL